MKLVVFIVCLGLSVPVKPDEEEQVFNDGDIKILNDVDGNHVVPEVDDVLVLNRENFNHVVVPKDQILVEFYAPWCGHCQALEPEYAKAAKILRADGIFLGKVDADREKDLAKEHMVTGFPTLTLFRKGVKTEDYEGVRSAEGIVEYMKRQSDPNWQPPPTSVLVLTQDNFTEVVRKHDIVLVEFYAPWCKHCQQMEPEYEAAAKILTQYGIPLAKVNGPKEKELSDQYGIKGWPGFKVFRRGRVYDYSGPREQKGIVDYMKDMAKLPSREVISVLEAKNAVHKRDATIFGFFEKNDTHLYNEYIAAANELRWKFHFLHTFKPDITEYYAAKADSILILQPEIFRSKYEESQKTLTKISAVSSEIIEFIKTDSLPLVGLRTKKNMYVKYDSRPLVVVYFDVNYDHQYIKDTEYIRKRVVEVAAKFKGTVTFAISNEEEYADELKLLGLDDSGEDVNVGYFSETYRYPMEPVEDFEPEALEKFVRDVQTEKIKPLYRSQKVPKKQEGPVRILVAQNFEDEVDKVEKDVLIEFYAPWCGHCKKLEPIYEKLAKHYRNNDKLVIAKMDAVANDIPPRFKVTGYPTLFFVPAFDKQNPILFESERTFNDLRAFVDRRSSVFLTEDERHGRQTIEERDEL